MRVVVIVIVVVVIVVVVVKPMLTLIIHCYSRQRVMLTSITCSLMKRLKTVTNVAQPLVTIKVNHLLELSEVGNK